MKLDELRAKLRKERGPLCECCGVEAELRPAYACQPARVCATCVNHYDVYVGRFDHRHGLERDAIKALGDRAQCATCMRHLVVDVDIVSGQHAIHPCEVCE